MSKRGNVTAMTAGQWRAWAERRTLNADAYVERLRMEASLAREVASEHECPYCAVAIAVPVHERDRYQFHRAYVIHELGCPSA
jgi:hypothetical protein